MREPARLARRVWIARRGEWVCGVVGVWGEEEEDGGEVSGSKTCVRARCVRVEIPASVRSLKAPMNRPNPC